MMAIYSRRSKKNISVKIKTPNHTSTLSPAGSFFKRRFSIKGFSLDDDYKSQSDKKVDNQSENINTSKESNKNIKNIDISGFMIKEENENEINDNKKNNNDNINEAYNKNISMVRLNNERTLEDNKKFKQIKSKDYNNKEQLKDVIDSSTQRYSSPTKYLQEKAGLNSLALLNKNIDCDKNLNPINEENEFQAEILEEKNIMYENWVFKLTENLKIKKFYLSLINKDIYYYKDKEKKTFFRYA